MTQPDPLGGMLAQVQQMQADLAAAQEALASETVEGAVGGGAVTATVSGTGELRGIRIDPAVVDPDDVAMLEDLVMAAVNDGMRRARELQSERMGAVTGGLDLGGLGGLGDLGGLTGG